MRGNVRNLSPDYKTSLIAQIVKILIVLVVSQADEWNNQLDRIALLRERYKTAVEDMESAAPAELCLAYGIPFLGIRIISNSIVTGESFEEAVGVDVQKFAVSFVERLHGMREEQE